MVKALARGKADEAFFMDCLLAHERDTLNLIIKEMM